MWVPFVGFFAAVVAAAWAVLREPEAESVSESGPSGAPLDPKRGE